LFKNITTLLIKFKLQMPGHYQLISCTVYVIGIATLSLIIWSYYSTLSTYKHLRKTRCTMQRCSCDRCTLCWYFFFYKKFVWT